MEIYQDILDKALDLMETAEGKEYLFNHFNCLNYYSSLFRQRGNLNSDKRLYEVMKGIYVENYKNMDISNSLLFMMYDSEIKNGHSEIALLVFENIIKQSQNIEWENIESIFTSLAQTPFSDELTPRLK